ncbi:unnamed protein product, partial [Gulo gulo]
MLSLYEILKEIQRPFQGERGEPVLSHPTVLPCSKVSRVKPKLNPTVS